MSKKRRDLIALVADKDIEATLRGVLSRPEALGIRPIDVEIKVDSQGHDPGCRLRASETLRGLESRFDYALVVYDHEGSGKESVDAVSLEREGGELLVKAGWSNARVIVIEPEVERWLWSEPHHLAELIGWRFKTSLEDYLREENHDLKGQPKAAFQEALRRAQRPESSSNFSSMAKRVSLAHCGDPAFVRLRDSLRAWFKE
jgi:hypothetical protein